MNVLSKTDSPVLSDSEISNIENQFKNLDLQINKIRGDHVNNFSARDSKQQVSITRNWYPRPPPPDMQFEEREHIVRSAFAPDVLYE